MTRRFRVRIISGLYAANTGEAETYPEEHHGIVHVMFDGGGGGGPCWFTRNEVQEIARALPLPEAE